MTNQSISPADEIGRIADRLRDIAATGSYFTKNRYDLENYAEIKASAMRLIALASDTPIDMMAAYDKTFFSRPGAVPVVDGAVIDQAGRLLLIRRSDNGLWAMPGGKIEVGETPAEAVEREVWEECSIRAKAVAMIGVYDSHKHGSPIPIQLFQMVFLCQPLGEIDVSKAHWSQSLEILAHGWFSAENIPTDLDPNHVSRIPHVFEFLKTRRTFFDPTPGSAG